MSTVHVRFFEELNQYLSIDQRKKWIDISTGEGTTLQNLLNTLKIPISEVELIIVNGHSQRLDYVLQSGDRLAVYPKFESFDIHEHVQFREHPLRNPKFLCDNHLGKLCKYLRMIGFDCLFEQLSGHPHLITQSNKENRIILSRDQKRNQYPAITHFILITSSHPSDQVKQVIRQLSLENFISPLSRCLRCNTPLVTVPKKQILHKLEPETARDFHEFFQCTQCQRIYWKGSHYENMWKLIQTKIIPQSH
jgi:hypothetical protein